MVTFPRRRELLVDGDRVLPSLLPQYLVEGLEKTKSLVNGQREGGRGRGKKEEGERVRKEGGWGREGKRKGRRKEGKSKHPGYSHPAYLPSLPNTMTEAESSDPQLVFLSFTDPGTTVRPPQTVSLSLDLYCSLYTATFLSHLHALVPDASASQSISLYTSASPCPSRPNPVTPAPGIPPAFPARGLLPLRTPLTHQLPLSHISSLHCTCIHSSPALLNVSSSGTRAMSAALSPGPARGLVWSGCGKCLLKRWAYSTPHRGKDVPTAVTYL